MPSRLTAEQRLLAIGLILGVTLVAFEVTSVATALPTISADLHGDGWYGLALSTYTLANMLGLVVAGEASDRHGPAVPFMVGTAVFIGGLVVSAVAPTMGVMVLGRTLQGLGNGGYSPIAYVLVRRAFPTGRQPLILAFLSAGWVLPSLLAPFVAGLVTQHLGWRWVFWLIVPAGVLVGVLNVGPMRRFPAVAGGTRPPSQFVHAGAAALGVGALVGGLQIPSLPAALLVSLLGLVVAVPALGRLLPRGMVGGARRRTEGELAGLAAVLRCRILATAAFVAVDGLLPLAAARVHGSSPTMQGALIIGAALTWTLSQWWSARRPVATSFGRVPLGFALLAAGTLGCVPVVWVGWPLAAVFASWSVAGIGMGLLFNPTSVAAISYTSPGTEGRVSGQLGLSDSLGFSVLGGISGGLVAIADHTRFRLEGAVVVSFAIAVALAAAGTRAGRSVRPSPTATPTVRVTT